MANINLRRILVIPYEMYCRTNMRSIGIIDLIDNRRFIVDGLGDAV